MQIKRREATVTILQRLETNLNSPSVELLRLKFFLQPGAVETSGFVALEGKTQAIWQTAELMITSR